MEEVLAEAGLEIPTEDAPGPVPEGVSEEGEMPVEAPEQQPPKSRWQKKKKKGGRRSPEKAILFCQGRESEKVFFVWTNIELNREKMPGYEGAEGS